MASLGSRPSSTINMRISSGGPRSRRSCRSESRRARRDIRSCAIPRGASRIGSGVRARALAGSRRSPRGPTRRSPLFARAGAGLETRGALVRQDRAACRAAHAHGPAASRKPPVGIVVEIVRLVVTRGGEVPPTRARRSRTAARSEAGSLTSISSRACPPRCRSRKEPSRDLLRLLPVDASLVARHQLLHREADVPGRGSPFSRMTSFRASFDLRRGQPFGQIALEDRELFRLGVHEILSAAARGIARSSPCAA